MIALLRQRRSPGLVPLLIAISAVAALALVSSVLLEVHFARDLFASTQLMVSLANVRRDAMRAILMSQETLLVDGDPDARDRSLAETHRLLADVDRRLAAIDGEALRETPGLRHHLAQTRLAWAEVCRASATALTLDDDADRADEAARPRAREALTVARGELLRAGEAWNGAIARALDEYVADLWRTGRGFVRVVVADLAFSIGLLLAAAVAAHLLIVRPLRALGRAVALVARGDYDVRVEPRGIAEVEALASGFNAMLATLAARDARISSQAGALAERNRALLSANAELDNFAYAASHDLRAPLRGIDSMARFLEEDWGPRFDERSRGYLARIRRAAQRLDRLINDLLEVARAGRALGPVEDVRPTDLVREALDEVSESARAAGAEVRVDDLSGLPTLRGDRLRLALVLQNLLSNAIKYSSGPGRKAVVTVSGRRTDDHLVLSVRDNGIGISPDQRRRIFGLFKRLHRDAYEGTGVGLAIVKRIVDAHGGRVWVESEEGRGSTFLVELPLEPSAQTEPVPATMEER